FRKDFDDLLMTTFEKIIGGKPLMVGKVNPPTTKEDSDLQSEWVPVGPKRKQSTVNSARRNVSPKLNQKSELFPKSEKFMVLNRSSGVKSKENDYPVSKQNVLSQVIRLQSANGGAKTRSASFSTKKLEKN